MTNVIVLAAGKGTRMENTELPKVLVTLFDKPLVRFVIEAIQKTDLGRPTVVIGHQSDFVREVLGETVDYAYQGEILGTGHAVAACKDHLHGKCDDIMVLYGDMPFISPETITRLHDEHAKSGATLTMATTTVPDFKDWRQSLSDYGRIIRNLGGHIADAIEVNDGNEAIATITEVNPSLYCFKADWLWKNIFELRNINAKSEYYLTDLVNLAFQQKQKITTMPVNPIEMVGVNTLEQLMQAEELLQKRVVRSV